MSRWAGPLSERNFRLLFGARTISFFGTNLALNPAWTLIFFRGRSPLAAGVEILVLEGTTVALVVHAWPVSRLAA